jgi:DNA adenine methylase
MTEENKIIRDFQLPLFGRVDPSQIVNVASVSHRSPFRYPGGKTWLVPLITQWLLSKEKRPRYFIEPFAGGGIIGLSVAFEKLANQIILVELDDQVASVWKTIISGNYEWLAKKIENFDLNSENVDEALNQKALSTEELAFQTILRNRVNRGGILAPGAGRIKNGENGKGLKSRWYPETLAKRILEIGKVRERITFIQGDGLKMIEIYSQDQNSVFFIDPPYTADGKKAGTRLYTHYAIDHEKLFNLAEKINGDFVMTYDDAAGVKQMAERHGFVTKSIAMKNSHHAEMAELIISPNYSWI